MIRMKVAGIELYPMSAQAVVILKDRDGEKGLPIWIGALEAQAIAYTLQNVKTARPLTHELLLSTLKKLGYSIDKIEIDKLTKDTFKATIHLTGEQTLRIDARPSDAIAIALSTNAPIFVPENLEFVTRKKDGDKTLEEDLQFKAFIKDLKASDFVQAQGKNDKSLDVDIEPASPEGATDPSASPGADSDLEPPGPSQSSQMDEQDLEDSNNGQANN